VDPTPGPEVRHQLGAGKSALDHEGKAEDAPGPVISHPRGLLPPEPESLQRPLDAIGYVLDDLAVSGHCNVGVQESNPLERRNRHLQGIGTIQEGIDPGHIAGQDGVTRNQDPLPILKEGDLAQRVASRRHDAQPDYACVEHLPRLH
jgi:hypothetical protein